jgi:dihydrofolate synthase/folylpolyglutamate synthase
VATWQEQYPDEKATVIFGAAANKDVAGMLAILAPIVKEWRFVTFQSPRAVPAVSLKVEWANLHLPNLPVTTCDSVAEALAAPAQGRRLVAGSLYLVGEAMALLGDRASEFRVTAQ